MPRLVWSRAATLDVIRLHTFLVTKSPTAARRAVAAIRAGVNILILHPEVGRPVVEMPEDYYRELILNFGQSAYVALYRFDGGQVTILAVGHGREAGY